MHVRTIGTQVIPIAVPTHDVEHLEWIMNVLRTHLGHLCADDGGYGGGLDDSSASDDGVVNGVAANVAGCGCGGGSAAPTNPCRTTQAQAPKPPSMPLPTQALKQVHAIGHQVMPIAVPTQDAELLEWNMNVLRTYLGHLRADDGGYGSGRDNSSASDDWVVNGMPANVARRGSGGGLFSANKSMRHNRSTSADTTVNASADTCHNHSAYASADTCRNAGTHTGMHRCTKYLDEFVW